MSTHPNEVSNTFLNSEYFNISQLNAPAKSFADTFRQLDASHQELVLVFSHVVGRLQRDHNELQARAQEVQKYREENEKLRYLIQQREETECKHARKYAYLEEIFKVVQQSGYSEIIRVAELEVARRRQ